MKSDDTILRPIRAIAPALALAILIPLVAGCNLVPLDPDAEGVRIVDADAARQCERLGRTTVQVLAKVLFVPRSEAKMSEELTTLARNAAAEMQGNAVAPETPISAGGQTFGIHRCPQP